MGSRALRNTAIVLGARVLSRAIALLTVVLTVHHLGSTGFGRFGTLVTYVAIVAVLIDLGFNTLYPREAAREPGRAGEYLGRLIVLRLLMAVPTLGVVALVLWPARIEDLLVPGFLMMVFQSFSGLFRQTFYALQHVAYEAAAIVLESLVLLGLTVAGIRAGAGTAWFVWAYALTWMFSCAFIVVTLHRTGMARIQPSFDPGFWRRWLRLSLPFAATFALTTLYFKSDQAILPYFRDYHEVGWYQAAYKPFEALLFVPVSMLNVVYPVLAVYFREAQTMLVVGVERFYRLLLLVGWPASVGVVVLAPGLARLLAYDQSAPALAILGAGIVLMFVNNAFIGTLNAIDRQGSMTRATIACFLLNLVLNLALIPPLGYLGAAWATVITELALGAIGWWLTSRYLFRLAVGRLSWRILVAGLVMGATLLPFHQAHGLPALVALVVLGAAVYALAIFLLRAIHTTELDMLRRSAG